MRDLLPEFSDFHLGQLELLIFLTYTSLQYRHIGSHFSELFQLTLVLVTAFFSLFNLLVLEVLDVKSELLDLVSDISLLSLFALLRFFGRKALLLLLFDGICDPVDFLFERQDFTMLFLDLTDQMPIEIRLLLRPKLLFFEVPFDARNTTLDHLGILSGSPDQ